MVDRSNAAEAVEDLGQQEFPRPMTAAEIENHPEYPHTTWTLEPTKAGYAPVGSGRGGPFKISYEIHGHGPRKLVWIMGLGGIKSAWQRQTKDFGHKEGDKYSCLIIDNRGIGHSDKPWMRYSTSQMAEDIVEVLEHIGWTDRRSLHVTGISMGGMIAQELGLLIPKRIASLNLISTGPYIKNTVGFFENLYNRAMLLCVHGFCIPRPIDTTLANIKYNLYSDNFLQHPDELEFTVQPFPTNGDRCMAGELHKRSSPALFPKASFILQAIAAGWHYKSPAQLKQLATLVGPERIQVVHGTRDRMVTFPHGEALLAGLGGEGSGVTWVWLEGQGHVVPIEMRKEFHVLIAGMVERTRVMEQEIEEEQKEGVAMAW
ncbi:alpha/beta-hydrolase [Microthyrium microscopicum]|uniref:Alpha/beta-hydrolase n=1 Tax=Microthyrium microscopicum TaxID=703497 RepID=A0A6A6U558_9PEZI|nr:alpha/beta-hydrolase [Microthyrium microscopicum]